jgi:hypothetical protein
MYSIPSTPFTCCSIGCATDCSTVCALAPGYAAETTTVGSVICGYCAIGSCNPAIVPTSTISSAVTIAKTGRPMKKLAMRVLIYPRVFSPRPPARSRAAAYPRAALP